MSLKTRKRIKVQWTFLSWSDGPFFITPHQEADKNVLLEIGPFR